MNKDRTQLETAKAAINYDGSTEHSLYAISESLLSIAESLAAIKEVLQSNDGVNGIRIDIHSDI